MKYRLKKSAALLWLVLAAIVVTSPVAHVHATQATRDRLNELLGQVAAAGERISDARNLLEGTQYEMAQIMLELQELDQQHMDAVANLRSIEITLLETEIRIYYAEAELQEAQAEVALQREILRTRLRAMQEHGQIGLLEVLFQAASISEFFMLLEYVRMVAEFDQNVLSGLEDAENRVQQTVDRLASERNLITNLQYSYDRARMDIELRQAERRAWFAALSEREDEFETILAIMEEEAHALDAEFGLVQRRHAQEVEEAQRRAREEAAARARAEAEARMATLNFDGGFGWPVPSSTQITSHFGIRTHPVFTNRTDNHTGIDIGARSGERIVAAADGYVRFSGWSGGYGNTVIIDHGPGYSTLYAHNSRNLVSAGQRVSRGQHIADIGSTGISTGPHLHFEIRRNNVAVNPMQFFGR